MKNSSSASQDYDLWMLLHQARDLTYKAREQELRQYGLSPIEAEVLLIVRVIGDKAILAEIARWVFREPNSITELINRMAGKGLVRKTKDPDKKNLVRVTLTEKGQQACQQSSESKSIQQILSSLSAEEKEQLGLLLEKLRNRGCEELGVDYRVPFPPAL